MESFRDNFQDRKGLITQVIHTDGVKKMMVYYEEEEKIKLKNLEDFLRLMLDHGIFDGILVYRKEITSSAKKVLIKFIITRVIVATKFDFNWHGFNLHQAAW